MIHDDANKKVTAHDVVFLTQLCMLIVVNSGRNTSQSSVAHQLDMQTMSLATSSEMSKEFQQLMTNYPSTHM